jgi:hypothetical protein
MPPRRVLVLAVTRGCWGAGDAPGNSETWSNSSVSDTLDGGPDRLVKRSLSAPTDGFETLGGVGSGTSGDLNLINRGIRRSTIGAAGRLAMD